MEKQRGEHINTRTNLRRWRNDAHYIIQVGYRGAKANPHIYAELRAITADTMSEIILTGELRKYLASDKLYSVAGATSPQKAVEHAVELFKEKELFDGND